MSSTRSGWYRRRRDIYYACSRLPGGDTRERGQSGHPRRDPDQPQDGRGVFRARLEVLGAVKLFELGKLSSGRAAQLAGLTRVEFLLVLREYQVSPFQMTAEELRQDVLNA